MSRDHQRFMRVALALTERRITLVTGILTEECAAVARSGPFPAGPR